jgi:molybdate transport system substrate-binding protein
MGTRARSRCAAPIAMATALALVPALGGCADRGAENARNGEGRVVELTVSAAASLADVFAELADAYSRSEPDAEITANYGSSAQLVQQVLAGARVDVVVTADEPAARPLLDAGLVAGQPSVMAENELVLVVPTRNPAGIRDIADLALPGTRVSICAEQVPCGRSTAEALAGAAVRLDAPSEENDVRAVLSKVMTGEVDAGFVYRTDARVAGDLVTEVPIESTVVNRYPVLVLRDSRDVDAAGEFRDWLLGPDAQSILGNAGFGRVG